MEETETILEKIAMVEGSTTKAMSDDVGKRTDYYRVDPRNIRTKPGLNIRDRDEEYEQAVRTIADSIKANGFFRDKALGCFVAKEDGKDVIYVYEGHRRHEACMLAISEGYELERIPVLIAPAGTSMVDIHLAMGVSAAASYSRLRPQEYAVLCKRLIGLGLDEGEIAKRLCMSEVYVKGLLQLIAGPKAVLDMVKAGKVSATLAIETLKKNGVDATDVLKQGLVTAVAAGKEKVTKKNIGAPKTPAPKKVNTWKVGIEYVKQHSLADDTRVIGLLVALTGKTEEEVLEALTTPATADAP